MVWCRTGGGLERHHVHDPAVAVLTGGRSIRTGDRDGSVLGPVAVGGRACGETAPGWLTLLIGRAGTEDQISGLVVVAVPLLMALVVPTADFVTSSGSILSIPEYSWMYRIPNELIAVPKVAVTVLAPAATFLA